VPAWLLDALGGTAASIAVSTLVVIAHRIERFFKWLQEQAQIVSGLDRAGARLATSAAQLADSAARLERTAARLEAAGRSR
jgi:hypothetical protein